MSHVRGERHDLSLLWEAAIGGDDRAVGELVRRTQPLIWRVCSALGSPEEVEDLVQETYVRALGRLPSYRGDAPVQAWLLSIARNVCADHVRRRRRERRLFGWLRAARQPEAQLLQDGAEGDLLDSLDAARREAFVLTQICGLSYAEAASLAGCPVGTIRSRVARARLELLTLVKRAEAR